MTRFYVYDRWGYHRESADTWEVWDRGVHGYSNRKLVKVFKTRIAADRHCIRCNADWERYRDSMRRSA